MKRLVLLAGAVAAGFFAWKKLTAAPADDEWEDALYEPPAAQPAATPSA